MFPMTSLKCHYYFLLITCSYLVRGDIYFHTPRGSNDRLNEKSANRNNGNRLFDSQNNNRGGYNVGESHSSPFTIESEQYNMEYFYSAANPKSQSQLTMEWTSQHGCGGNEATDPHKQNCNIVLQYMCDEPDGIIGYTPNNKKLRSMRNGVTTATPTYAPTSNGETSAQFDARYSANVKLTEGLHEPITWYDKCITRPRNQGLFTADQNLKGRTSKYTRQNPNGNRNGYECPEERDYYPYWQPTPWKDIAVLTDNTTHCSYFMKESFNTRSKWECVLFHSDTINNAKPMRRYVANQVTQEDCTKAGGQWTEMWNYLEIASSSLQTQSLCEAETKKTGGRVKYQWGIPYDAIDVTRNMCMVMLPDLECRSAPWSRSNHLGDSRDGRMAHYDWTLPYFPSLKEKRCVVRIRYNISTDDYDPFNTTAEFNKNKSPVRNNPTVDIGLSGTPLRLAINTAQFGRTFQDRSHVFLLKPRPQQLPLGSLYNMNVRGKRGSIVQVYPGVPYSFTPSHLTLPVGALVHLQWTGSNTHNNGRPQGDGQVGSDGEGSAGTDRHNAVEVPFEGSNFPTAFESSKLFRQTQVVWRSHPKFAQMNTLDHSIALASSGYYQCVKASTCQGDSFESKSPMNPLLNNAAPSFDGVIFRFPIKGQFNLISTRNNNFGEKTQRAVITIV